MHHVVAFRYVGPHTARRQRDRHRVAAIPAALAIALLLASLGAGTLWELFGSASTFYAGALICAVTLIGMKLAPFGERRP
ncbi:hypothetical protein [Serratia marcescens]|uniref:hypothetical protein n=1 Tax=Serratia marcescens TaxID=615 RepID=UPI003F75ABEE